MSSDRDPSLFPSRNQQLQRGSGYLTSSPDSAFRRPPPPRGTPGQQLSQLTRSRHSEPIRSGLIFGGQAYKSSSSRSKLSIKSTTSTPISSGSKSTITQSRRTNPPAHLQEHGHYRRAKFPPLPFSAKTSRNTNPSGKISSHVSSFPQAPPRPPTHLHAPVPMKPENIMTAKASQSLPPLWHELDDTNEEQLRVKRRREEAGIYSAKRIVGRKISAANSHDTIDVADPDRPKSNILPRLRIHSVNQPDNSDSDHDEPRYRPQARLRSRKTTRPQIAPKRSAARKVNFVNTTSSEEDSDDDKNEETSSSSEEDQLDSDQYDVDVEEPSLPHEAHTPPEIMILDSPPKITIPLSQIDLSLVDDPAPQSRSIEPSDELITALESLALPTIRMQKTHQLPFLLRNVREGFLSRCRALGVPIYSHDRQLSLCVRYDYVAGPTYITDISNWLCPLCELHGIFRTREMLDCHLQWDHAEVYSEWERMVVTEESESWNLQLVIPEPEIQPKIEDERHSILSVDQTPTAAVDEKLQPRSIPNTPTSGTEASRNTYSPFPYVSLSPSSVQRSTITPTSPSRTPSIPLETKNVTRLGKLKIQEDSDFPSRSTSTRSSNTRSSVTTTRSIATVRPDGPSRHLTPPPPDNLLGPAAQPPYLPAKSEYGGPTVYHSYRPGGPCLFDLLNTLPLDQFGVLDWEILDREEEIYESDDVKEEYKVMHALWARWIMLNRKKFIANYFKGMLAFVDEYWKIIHRAAGWDALRYWSLMMLSNHFLTGHEVAQVLLHYENRVGMAFW